MCLSGGTLNGWTQTAPSLSKGEYLWVIQASAYSNTSTDTIAASEFTAASITGIAGADGYTPVKGVDYFDGVDGTDGSDGDSAYQAWLDAGNSGTTTAFLNSLVGADGADGTDGIPGTNGVNGVTTYTWIKYADNGTGTVGFSNSPTGKDYIGFAFNKTTATESTNPADYTWSLIKGADGADGNNGTDGSTVVTGKVYYQILQSNQPSTPSASSYNVSTASFSGLTSNWSLTQPSVEITDTSLKEWSSNFTVTIDGVTSVQTIVFTTPSGAIQVTADLESDNYVANSFWLEIGA